LKDNAMLTPEINYLVAVEQHKTDLERMEQYQLRQIAATVAAVPPRFRVIYCWLGKRLQAWGAKLEAYGAPANRPMVKT
jgi:hypothetical protein